MRCVGCGAELVEGAKFCVTCGAGVGAVSEADGMSGGDEGRLDFRFVVIDVFSIVGRGTVVLGQVASGQISVGDDVLINGMRSSVVMDIEAFAKTIDMARAGDNVGLLLRGIARDEVEKGNVITRS
jgi:translation elongation factor EF-Tu-like GTPase